MKYFSSKNIQKRKKIIFSICFLLCFFFCLIFSIFISHYYIEKNALSTSSPSIVANTKGETQEEPIKTITITALGDIMCHNSQYKDAYQNSSRSYDFSYVFKDISSLFENRDIVIGNLETTFAGAEKGYSSYPTFNTPEQLATDLKELGIDVLSTANNHSLDTGYLGLANTLNELDKVEISHTGTYRSAEEQDQILIKKVNGLKVAFLSFTYGTNGIPVPSGKEYCINLIDTSLILSQIEKAKEQNADIIIANMHWGIEYRTVPTVQQEELADFLFQNGVDIILGSHPHVLEPMEIKEITMADGSKKTGFVIYSLGNFMSGQTKENTRDSVILNLTISKKGQNPLTIEDVSYVPIYCYTSKGNFKGYQLIDIQKNIEAYKETGSSLIPSSKLSFFEEKLIKITNVMNARKKESS